MNSKTKGLPTKKAEAVKAIVKDKSLGKIDKIIMLAKKGLSKKEIVELKFNRNTVYRQVREYEMA